MNDDGIVPRVWYSRKSDFHATNIKKSLIQTLSNRLIISEEAYNNQKMWAYRVNETEQDGKYIYRELSLT